MMSSPGNIFRIKAGHNSYDWGKKGHDSLVAKFMKNATGDDENIDESKPYAELWMGTHPNNPSFLWSDPSKSLRGLIQASPLTYLGASLTTPFSATLGSAAPSGPGPTPHSTHVPYLFKVLSIALALPLQSHPSKPLAEKLHRENPKQFVDANHKPEISIAVEDGFRGFVGFGEHQWAKQWLENVEDVRGAVGDEGLVEEYLKEQTNAGLKKIFGALLNREANEIQKHVVALVRKVERLGAKAVCGDESISEVVKLLHGQYGGDVGVIAAPFFMNFVTLSKGEAVYIPADTIHAYLEGDIIECMATSDNVLNAGFVPPSSRQTSTFIDSITYNALPASAFALPRTPYDKARKGNTFAYNPPIEEFTVLWTRVKEITNKGERHDDPEFEVIEVLEAVLGPTMCIVTIGKVALMEEGKLDVLELGEGGVAFVKPGTVVQLLAANGVGTVEVWWAMWDGNN